MATSNAPEVWLRGPLPGYAPALMPIAHALLQAREDVERVAIGATAEELSRRPGGAASAGYHLQHLAGSLDRLFTYARGEPLSEAQRAALLQEGTPGTPGSELVPAVLAQIDQALEQLRHTTVESLGSKREVGRAKLPSTVVGLLFHAAEHSSRHVGQLITTLKVVRGLASAQVAI
jgi:DinB superfamily